MAKVNVKKKNSSGEAQSVETRIVELSLQNPEYGAKRLLPLLKSDDIDISASTVYSILRRNGLQTRAKRLAKIKKIVTKTAPVQKRKANRSRKKPVSALRKKSAGLTVEVADRIVQISLQNPDYGAKRLVPLLEKKGIRVAASAVYRILKHNGLQNRAKRYEKIQAQQVTESPPPETVEIPSPPAVAIPIPVAQVEVVPEIIKKREAPARVLAVNKAPEKTKFRNSWLLTLANILLLILLLYSGFHTLQSFRSFSLAPEAIAAEDPAPTATVARLESAAPPLTDYRTILERNLFNVSKEEVSAPEKEIAVEKITPAQKDLGLKLVGTAVTDNAKMNRAFIDNRKSRQQEAYREGDAIGEVRIKKIMRNRVIISTVEGDRLLTVDIGEGSASTSLNPAPNKQRQQAAGEYPQQTAERRRPGRSFKLAREEVEASLVNIDELEQLLNIEPYLKDDQPVGFTIGRIPPDSVLRKMGLKSGNAILGVNDEVFTGPEQAAEFFRMLAAGGELTVKARIGRGVRRRTRYMHLNIE